MSFRRGLLDSPDGTGSVGGRTPRTSRGPATSRSTTRSPIPTSTRTTLTPERRTETYLGTRARSVVDHGRCIHPWGSGSRLRSRGGTEGSKTGGGTPDRGSAGDHATTTFRSYHEDLTPYPDGRPGVKNHDRTGRVGDPVFDGRPGMSRGGVNVTDDSRSGALNRATMEVEKTTFMFRPPFNDYLGLQRNPGPGRREVCCSKSNDHLQDQ